MAFFFALSHKRSTWIQKPKTRPISSSKFNSKYFRAPAHFNCAVFLYKFVILGTFDAFFCCSFPASLRPVDVWIKIGCIQTISTIRQLIKSFFLAPNVQIWVNTSELLNTIMKKEKFFDSRQMVEIYYLISKRSCSTRGKKIALHMSVQLIRQHLMI